MATSAMRPGARCQPGRRGVGGATDAPWHSGGDPPLGPVRPEMRRESTGVPEAASTTGRTGKVPAESRLLISARLLSHPTPRRWWAGHRLRLVMDQLVN